MKTEEPSTYQMILQAREHSPLRGALVQRYATEQGVSISTVWSRLKSPDQLDDAGNFKRHERSDKGTYRGPHAANRKNIVQAEKALQNHPTMCLTELAALTGLDVKWLRRVNHHHAPPDRSAPGTVP
jgi:hypothetical protein